MTRRLALLTLGLVLAVLGLPASATASTVHPAVVVVGIPGLRWDQVSATGTPTLWRLAHTGSVGSLSIRSADPLTCPRDGWLTVGAGNRVRVPDCAAPNDVVVEPAGARVGVYPSIVQVNQELDFAAVPGTLASSLRTSSCVAALGVSATVGAADSAGHLGYFSSTLSREALSRCPVTMIDAGEATDRAGAAAADVELSAVDRDRPAGSVLLVVGLSDTAGGRSHLHVAIAAGGPYTVGALHSQSTRRAPYVQLIDVAATVLELRGVAQSSHIDGQPWRTSGRAPSPSSLADLDKAAGAAGGALVWVVAFLVVLVVAGSALVLIGRRRIAALVLLTALGAPAMTYLVNLTPWYDAPQPTLVTIAATLVMAAILGLIAFQVGQRRSWVIAAGLVSGFTFLVVVADLVTGAHLQVDSVLGYSPLVAGRFAGVGNVGYGVLASAAVLLATAVAIKAPGWREVALIGAVAVVVDGAPMWGSDVGGVLALVPGFGLLVLLTARKKVSVARLLALGTAAVAVVAVFALADYSRPASHQTHLGRFVGKVLHGGAGTIIDRKWHSDLDLLTANAGTLFVPIAAAVALWLVLRPRPRLARTYARHPELRYGLISLAVVAFVGLVVNDSGIAIPAVVVLLAVPYTLVTMTGLTLAADTSTEPPAEDQHVLP
jgi:hypothetical protein